MALPTTGPSLRRRARQRVLRSLPAPAKSYLRARRAASRRPQPPTAVAYTPRDHARQVGSRYYIQEALTGAQPPDLVVDLGCGDGSSAAIFRSFRSDVTWIGVDIEQSTSAKAITGEQVIIYDGVHLPFPDSTIPLIYTNQVFEHVRHPEALLREIRRVLTPGGVFVGSVSQLEPYHSYSIVGGYTLYGWSTFCHDAGLVLEEARPSIDALSLINRQYQGAPAETAAWWQLSPLNVEIDAWADERGASALETNARKLQFCGQFAFRVRKPGNPAGNPGGTAGSTRSTSASGAWRTARQGLGRAALKVGFALVR